MTHHSYDENTKFLDITEPDHAEITVRQDKQVIWINIDGICAVRICRIKKLKVEIL